MAEKPRKKHPLSFAAWLIILVASIFSVSLLLFAFSYVSFREQQENILLDTLDKNGRQAADYTNALLTDIENVLVLPLFAGDTGSFFEEAAVYAQTGEKSAAYSQSVRQSLQMLFNYKTTIHAVVFYVPGRGSDSVLRGVNNLSLSPPAGQPWYDACAADLNGGPVLVSTYKLYASDYGGRDTYVFGVARSVIDVDNSRVAGVLQIGINETTLYSFLKNALTLPGQELVVADGEGRIISSTDRTAVGKLLSETAFTAVLGEAGDAQRPHQRGRRQLDRLEGLQHCSHGKRHQAGQPDHRRRPAGDAAAPVPLPAAHLRYFLPAGPADADPDGGDEKGGSRRFLRPAAGGRAQGNRLSLQCVQPDGGRTGNPGQAEIHR